MSPSRKIRKQTDRYHKKGHVHPGEAWLVRNTPEYRQEDPNRHRQQFTAKVKEGLVEVKRTDRMATGKYYKNKSMRH